MTVIVQKTRQKSCLYCRNRGAIYRPSIIRATENIFGGGYGVCSLIVLLF